MTGSCRASADIWRNSCGSEVIDEVAPVIHEVCSKMLPIGLFLLNIIAGLDVYRIAYNPSGIVKAP